MLAALLCNLGGTPVPPKPPAAQPFFGGGPFTRRYGYDPRYYSQEELPEDKALIAEAAIVKAVAAIRAEKPKRVVLDAKAIYQRVYREVLDIERARVNEMWREELKQRLQQAEEEDLIVCLMCL